jgi:hypothetical protein
MEVQDDCDVIPSAGTRVLLFFLAEGRESSPFLARIACPLPRHFCGSLLLQKHILLLPMYK